MTTYTISRCRCGWARIKSKKVSKKAVVLVVLVLLIILIPKLVFGFQQKPIPSMTLLAADLVPFFIWTGSTVNATSTDYHFSVTVKNIGTSASQVTKTRLRIDLRSNGTWDYEAFRNTGPKVPGSVEGELWASAVTLPNVSARRAPVFGTFFQGDNFFQICVDALDSEAELSEANNCRRGVF